MSKKNRFIQNPNNISNLERNFIKNNFEENVYPEEVIVKEKYKGRMISMSDSFYKTLNDYLKRNPTEGNRSSFIVTDTVLKEYDVLLPRLLIYYVYLGKP